jgi:hypothetical protein
MRLLGHLLMLKEQCLSKHRSIRQLMFSAPSIKLFPYPVEGRIEIRTGYAPRVRYSATLWRIKYRGSLSELKDGQFVAVIGMQGNALIISTEASIDAHHS